MIAYSDESWVFFLDQLSSGEKKGGEKLEKERIDYLVGTSVYYVNIPHIPFAIYINIVRK